MRGDLNRLDIVPYSVYLYSMLNYLDMYLHLLYVVHPY